VLDIKVNEGAEVKEGDVIFILEAMKMENEITATSSGVVTQIVVTKGQLVDTNETLAVIG
jgi:biotin carboxyl carrier protein